MNVYIDIWSLNILLTCLEVPHHQTNAKSIKNAKEMRMKCGDAAIKSGYDEWSE